MTCRSCARRSPGGKSMSVFVRLLMLMLTARGHEITRFGGIKHCKYMIVLSDFSEKNTALFGVGHIMSPVQAISWGYLWAIHMFDRLLLPGQCTKMSSASSAPFFMSQMSRGSKSPVKKRSNLFGLVFFLENWFRKVSFFKYVSKVDFFHKRSLFLMNCHGTIGTFYWCRHRLRQRTPRPVVVSLQEGSEVLDVSWISLEYQVWIRMNFYMGVSENNGTPKSSILIGFSIINHPLRGTPIFGNTHMYFLDMLKNSFSFGTSEAGSLWLPWFCWHDHGKTTDPLSYIRQESSLHGKTENIPPLLWCFSGGD